MTEREGGVLRLSASENLVLQPSPGLEIVECCSFKLPEVKGMKPVSIVQGRSGCFVFIYVREYFFFFFKLLILKFIYIQFICRKHQQLFVNISGVFSTRAELLFVCLLGEERVRVFGWMGSGLSKKGEQ